MLVKHVDLRTELTVDAQDYATEFRNEITSPHSPIARFKLVQLRHEIQKRVTPETFNEI